MWILYFSDFHILYTSIKPTTYFTFYRLPLLSNTLKPILIYDINPDELVLVVEKGFNDLELLVTEEERNIINQRWNEFYE